MQRLELALYLVQELEVLQVWGNHTNPNRESCQNTGDRLCKKHTIFCQRQIRISEPLVYPILFTCVQRWLLTYSSSGARLSISGEKYATLQVTRQLNCNI